MSRVCIATEALNGVQLYIEITAERPEQVQPWLDWLNGLDKDRPSEPPSDLEGETMEPTEKPEETI